MVDYKKPSEDWDKREKILGEVDYNFGQKISDEIGAMLWTEMSLLDKTLNQ